METIKIVNGYKIQRHEGERGYFWVYITENKFRTFRTMKAAIEFCKTL